MVWLLDGYNVIRRDPELSALDRGSLEEGRNALLRLVAHAAGGSADDFIVVFDGVRATATTAPPGGRRVRVIFSRLPDKADDEPRPAPKRGNPRRLSRAERQARRALDRLRPR